MKKRPRILVVGSFVMDLIVSTEKFPVRGESVFGNGFINAPGGKGANQAVQAARLGVSVKMVGAVGGDDFGRQLLSTAAQSQVDVSSVITADAPTSIANVILELIQDGSTQNRIIIVPGANMSIKPHQIEFLKDEISSYDMVVLQLEIPMEINKIVARLACDAGVPVILNCAPYAPCDDDFLSCISCVCPNEHEAALLSGLNIENDDDINLTSVEKAAKVILNRGVKQVVITLGKSGAAFCDAERFIYKPAAQGITAVDPTAAGDSFIGGFVTALCAGYSHGDALVFGNYVAAKTVTKVGAMPALPSLTEIIPYMKQNVPNFDLTNIEETYG